MFEYKGGVNGVDRTDAFTQQTGDIVYIRPNDGLKKVLRATERRSVNALEREPRGGSEIAVFGRISNEGDDYY